MKKTMNPFTFEIMSVSMRRKKLTFATKMAALVAWGFFTRDKPLTKRDYTLSVSRISPEINP